MQWKRDFLEGVEQIFSKKKGEEKANDEQDKDQLYSKIDRFQTEVHFFKKVLVKWVWIKNDIWFNVKTVR